MSDLTECSELVEKFNLQPNPSARARRPIATSAAIDGMESLSDLEVATDRIYKRNLTTISTVDAAQCVKQRKYHMELELDGDGKGRIVARETVSTTTKEAVYASFTPTGTIIPVSDPFNRNLNYSMKTVADVFRLNSDLHGLVALFIDNFDDNNTQAVALVRTLAQNLLVVHDNVQAIAALMQDGEDRMEEFTGKLAGMNISLTAFHAANGLTFTKPKPNLPTPHDLNITYDQWSALQSWLPSLTAGKESSVLYRMSAHGQTPSDFHSRCDDKGRTVSIIETADGCVFGGFTSASWHSRDAFIACTEAFVFSLVNPHKGTAPTKFPLNPDQSNYAIVGSRNYFVVFGYSHNTINCEGNKTVETRSTTSTFKAPEDAFQKPNAKGIISELTVISWP